MDVLFLFCRGRTRNLHPCAKRNENREVRQGSCEWPKAIRGMPGSEFEPRSPLQKKEDIRKDVLFPFSFLKVFRRKTAALEKERLFR